jgi:hypothetical protein
MEFSSDIETREINRKKACEVYEYHHSYMSGDDVHPAAIAHYGIFYQDRLVGAITFRTAFGKRRKIHFDDNGDMVPRPEGNLKLHTLPDEIETRAKRFMDPPADDKIAYDENYGGTEIIEVSRICIGVNMPNLASCALAAASDAFVRSDECPDDTKYLMTMVRADFSASMIKALKDRGWTLRNVSSPSQAGNRKHKSIRERYRWVWVCPAEKITHQHTLTEY